MAQHDSRKGPPHGGRTHSGRLQTDLLEIDPEDDGREILEFEGTSRLSASIKVIGVGGGGGNAIDTMIEGGLSGVEFIAANTDAQALQHNHAVIKLQLGAESTRGLGCGAMPEKGKKAALEARDRLRDLLIGTDMVFVTAGMGGGTGTGAAPIVAEVAREVGALTVAVVTKPFPFEGKSRMRHAERGLEELHSVVDTLITIPNQRLLALAGKGTAMKDAFKLADDVLTNAVRGISDLITVHGLINLDFADVRTIMSEMGMALMGTGMGRGESRAIDAARGAISSPLLEDLSIDGARGVLINITGGPDMTLFEVNEAATLVQEAAHEDANIIFGAVVDERLAGSEMRVTVIATGLQDGRVRRERPIDLDNGWTPRKAAPEWDGSEEIAAGGHMRVMRRETPVVAEAPVAQAPQPLASPFASDSLGTETGADYVSPFDDELDVPAFLRRAGSAENAVRTDDREVPTFLRRTAD